MLEMLLGGALVLAGQAFGALLRRTRSPKIPEAYCGCRHHLSKHDPQTGECHQTVPGYNRNGLWGAQPCGCRQYVGPVPAELMLASFKPREMP